MLFGRETDRRRLAAAIADHRLITLVGPGGVGKTALARDALEDLDPDRSGFVDLTEQHPAGLIEGVAGALGFASFDELLDEVGADPWTFVVDNCEHLVDSAASAVATVLDHCPNVTVLATSRMPLDLRGEHVIRVEPLDIGGSAASPSAASGLFLARASDRGVRDLDPAVVEDLCRRLDGLPLAIELAAAKTSTMTPSEILDSLGESIAHLDSTFRDTPSRHRSLTAAVSWSFDQLEQAERDSLLNLSIFEGPFTRDLAAAVLGGDRMSSLDLLTERSLVVHEPANGVSWYRILSTIRDFAVERLAETDRLSAAWDQAANEVAQQLERLSHAPVMGEKRVPVVLDRGFWLVRRVIEDAIEAGNEDRCLQLFKPFWWYESMGHPAEAAELLRRFLARWAEPVASRGVAYGLLATLDESAGHEHRTGETARIAISSGNPLGAALGHRVLGQYDRRRALWPSALEHFEAGEQAARRASEPALAVELTAHTGLTLARSGDLAGGIAAIEAVLDEAADYPLCATWTRLFLAWLLLPNDPARAARLSQEVLDDRGMTGDHWTLATCHHHLSIVAAIDGHTERALAEIRTSLAAFLKTRSKWDVVLNLMTVAALLNRTGDSDNAAAARATAEGLVDPLVLGDFEMDLFATIGPLPDPAGAKPRDPREFLALLDHPAAAPTVNRFSLVGEMWELTFGGHRTLVPRSKGIADLAHLISRPGIEVEALELMGSGVTSGGSSEASDQTALAQYRARIEELQDEIDEAQADNDPHRADRPRAELEALLEHLSSSYGLGGRRRVVGDPVDKARSAVTWRIRSAIDRIREVHPELATHLDESIQTGRACAYRPQVLLPWTVSYDETQRKRGDSSQV